MKNEACGSRRGLRCSRGWVRGNGWAQTFLAGLSSLVISGELLADSVIESAQSELRARKLYHGSVDGKMNTGFQKALREFQGWRGFEESGELTHETLEALGIRESRPADPESGLRESLYRFLEEHLREMERGDVDAVLAHCAGSVDFFSDGIVDSAFIRRTFEAQCRRWPYRRYVLLNRIASPDPEVAQRWHLTFRYRSTVRDDKSEATSVTEDNTFLVERRGDHWEIISMKVTGM